MQNSSSDASSSKQLEALLDEDYMSNIENVNAMSRNSQLILIWCLEMKSFADGILLCFLKAVLDKELCEFVGVF
ncbi:hypothetical protein G6F56_007551 [Rhizopus delemar]|nr:hypothetical protein G6F56_007551 [Rhizopus delemar]